MRRVLIAAAVLTLTHAAHAYRPFDGTDADVAPLGEIELEVGPVGYLWVTHSPAVVTPALIFNLGFLPRWELVVQGSGLFVQSAPGAFVNGGAFVKHVLREGTLQGKTGLSLASEVGVLLPTVGLSGTEDAGVYIGFIASYAWPKLALHFNTSIARSNDALGELFIGAILEGVPSSPVRPVAELIMQWHGAEHRPSALIGCIARASKRLSFDAATRIGSFGDAPTFEVRLGFTWSFEVVARRDQ